jgi:predicted lipid-binding transport protein (Tim44 family)
MSHLGLGAEFGNILMMVLLGIVAIVAIRFVLRRFGPNPAATRPPQGLHFAGAGATPSATGGSGWGAPATATAASAQPIEAAAPTAASGRVPAGFDTAGFERIAKMIFIRMQAANDSGDLNDLRAFTTPEMFASLRVDLQDRGGASQTTDVVRIDAEVLDVETEGASQVVSVRFHGLIREEKDGIAAPFDEVWHLVKPLDGSREWAIAGVQQIA